MDIKTKYPRSMEFIEIIIEDNGTTLKERVFKKDAKDCVENLLQVVNDVLRLL